jgi:hypothetical protein
MAVAKITSKLELLTAGSTINRSFSKVSEAIVAGVNANQLNTEEMWDGIHWRSVTTDTDSN